MNAEGLVDVYVTPDDEILSFDDAETGIRTLLQNQRDDRLLGRMRAAALARMTVGDEQLRRYTPGRPWVDLRRKVMSGDYRTAKTDVECGDTLDVGTSAEHVDRLLQVGKSRLSDDVRARRFALTMSPLAFPETVSGQVRNMYRDRDVDAMASTEPCGGMTVRLLARRGGVAADEVSQRGVALWDLPERPSAMPTVPGSIFNVEEYHAHLLSLRPGDAVVLMLDAPSDPRMLMAKGRVQTKSAAVITVGLDDGARVLTNDKGEARILPDVNMLHRSDGFIYGTSWKGPRFSRTSTKLAGAAVILIPWATTMDVLPIVEPRPVHRALARSLTELNTSLESLFDTDDVSLDRMDTRVVEILVGQAIALQPVDEEEAAVQEEVSTAGSGEGDEVSFLLKMKETQGEPKRKKKKKQNGKLVLQQGGAPSVLRVIAPCGELWGPSTILEALCNQCVDLGLAGMAQGHLVMMTMVQMLSVQDLSSVVREARGRREEAGMADAAHLAASVSLVATHIRSGVGSRRLDQEILAHAAPRWRGGSVSPFDAFRHLDILRWLMALARDQSYENFKGNEQTAFDADLAETRLLYEERTFYRKFAEVTGEETVTLVTEKELPDTPILLEMLVESCAIQGLQEGEISAVLRNTRHYRPDDAVAGKIRKRIELVKRAGNREFKELNPVSRAALQKRLIDKVRATVVTRHAIETLSMLAALLIMIVRLSQGRIRPSLSVLRITTGVQQIVRALLPSEHETSTTQAVSAMITDDIKKVEMDKALNGVTLIVKEDQLHALVRPRAVRDTAWTHFRPMLINLSALKGGHQISAAMRTVADMQRPFLDAVPMIVEDGRSPARHNVCCAYILPDRPPIALKVSASPTRRDYVFTILQGTTAIAHVIPVPATQYVGPAQEQIKLKAAGSTVKKSPVVTWMEDEIRMFLDSNLAFANDDALSRIAASNSKVAWSSLASQNLARFDEMTSRVMLAKEKSDMIRSQLLVPSILKDSALRQLQAQASTFLRSIVIPLLGRLSNNVHGHPDSDHEAIRLNLIMAAHDPGEDVSTLRSTLATYGDIRSSETLMLVTGPSSPEALRSSVQLLMGVALSALWRTLADAGGGPMGATIVKPVVLICLDRLAVALRFALADDSVTRLIQEQREDAKLRKIEIYKRISPEDIEAVQELRQIRQDLNWDEIERNYATIAESATQTHSAHVSEGLQQEVGALGAYPDDDREVHEEDGDQEMMDFVD